MSEPKLSIYHYLDYREFLRDQIAQLKQDNRYSARSFAEAAGFGSPSYLKMILDGKRNLGGKATSGVAKALGLNRTEADFFDALVAFNNAEKLSQKDTHYQKLLGFKRFHEVREIDAIHYEYLSQWYYVALREAMSTPLQKKDPNELAKLFDLTPGRVRDAFEVLCKLGLIEKQGEYFKTKEGALSTPAQLKSIVARNFHRQMIEKAGESLDRFPSNEREMGALTIALNEEQYQLLCQQLAMFRRQINALCSDSPSANRVYQFNYQLFPLHRKDSDS